MSSSYTTGSIRTSGSGKVSVTTSGVQRAWLSIFAGILNPAPPALWITRVLDDNVRQVCDTCFQTRAIESCLVKVPASHTCEFRNGVSLTRSLELAVQWDCILRAGLVHPVSLDDVLRVQKGGHNQQQPQPPPPPPPGVSAQALPSFFA